MSWPTEHLDFVRNAWTKGQSAGQIAVALNKKFPGNGYTRNGVSGQVTRHVGKRAPSASPRVIAAPAQRTRVRMANVTAEPKFAEGAKSRLKTWPVPDTAVTLAQASAGACRFPVGTATGADQLFCGATKTAGKPYCGGCQARIGGAKA